MSNNLTGTRKSLLEFQKLLENEKNQKKRLISMKNKISKGEYEFWIKSHESSIEIYEDLIKKLKAKIKAKTNAKTNAKTKAKTNAKTKAKPFWLLRYF